MTPLPQSSLHAHRRALVLAGGLACGLVSPLLAQGSIDPYVAPRAVEMDRSGERAAATEYLGRYLATAPDDGRAWLALGRFYLMDARDWHARGHAGVPDASMVLDFAVTALEQAVRLQVDSGEVLRDQAEVARALLVTEDSGWDVARADWAQASANDPALPGIVTELGANLVNSCPEGGVILTGSDLENLGVWSAILTAHRRTDIVPIVPRLYATDARYRTSLARALGVDPALGIRAAMTQVAGRRAVCATPLADSAAVPGGTVTVVRLVRVTGPDTVTAPDYLTFTSFLATARAGRSVWLADVMRSYAAAAGHNPALCRSIFGQVADRPDDVCH
ncbi:MAG: hypothetical protein WBC97_02745 [Gemmatimonadales bacterium]